MIVYNYLGADFQDGAQTIEDAPPEVSSEIERWLRTESRTRNGDWLLWQELPSRGLTLASLRRVAHGRDGRQSLDLIQVLAIPETDLPEPDAEAIRGIFEALHGQPLEPSIASFQRHLAAHPQAEVATQVAERFARGPEIEGRLRSAAPRAFAPRARIAGRLQGRRIGVALAGLAGVAIGFGAARLAPTLGQAAAPDVPPSPVAAPDPRILVLEEKIEELLEALRQRERIHERAVAELARTPAEAPVEAGKPRLAAAAAPLVSAPPPTIANEPSQGTAVPDEAPGASESEPPKGAPESEPEVYRVMASLARVRAGPSTDHATRGLLPADRKLSVTDASGEWLRIVPPDGFEEPSWIHASVVDRLGGSTAATAAP